MKGAVSMENGRPVSARAVGCRHEEDGGQTTMERREMLIGCGVATLGVFAGEAFAGQHENHAHSTVNQGLITTSSNCVSTGEVCVNHCLAMLAQGDKSFAACARSVNDLIAACTALRSLAAQNSIFLPKYAKLTAEVCKSCEVECRKFEKDHAECKACADACAACIAECTKIA